MTSPLVRRWRLASELRARRDARKMTTQDVADVLGWTVSKTNRVMLVAKPPKVDDIVKVLEALEVADDDFRTLVGIANDAAQTGWWTSFGEHMGARQAVNADLEWGAATVRDYAPAYVPGLLQTPGYTRARAVVSGLRGETSPTWDVNRAIDARMARQRMVRGAGGPTYEVILDELVFRRLGAPPDVMRDQVVALIGLAEDHGATTIRVLPIDARIDDYWLPVSAYNLYSYPDPADPVVLAVEGEADDRIAIAEPAVESYAANFDRLRAAALDPAASIDLLRTAERRLA